MKFNETHWSRVTDLRVIPSEEVAGAEIYTALFTPIEPDPEAWDPPTRTTLGFKWQGQIYPYPHLSAILDGSCNNRDWCDVCAFWSEIEDITNG